MHTRLFGKTGLPLPGATVRVIKSETKPACNVADKDLKVKDA